MSERGAEPSDRRAASGAPWYRQFWPIFIAALMAISIAASLATVVIAYRHADEDVRAGGVLAPGPPVRAADPAGAAAPDEPPR